MVKTKKTFLTLSLLAFVLIALASTVQSSNSPFAQAGHNQTSISVKGEKSKCGEGKCGSNKSTETTQQTSPATEKKCGEGKCGNSKTPKTKKCGEGKCGDNKVEEKSDKKKCGEGKCG